MPRRPNAVKDVLLNLFHGQLSKLNVLRNRHKGEECYLLGDGVSVKWFDMKCFSDKISIALSFMPFHREFASLDSRYLLMTGPFWFYPHWFLKAFTRENQMPLIAAAYREIVERERQRTFFIHLSNRLILGSPSHIYYMFRDIPDDTLPKQFVSRRFNALHGCFRTSLLVAMYLGFSKCYLVGCDYTHIPSRSLHYFEKGPGLLVPQADYNRDYLLAAREFIDITTITLDGTSPFIEAVTYESFTGRKPAFKENTDLVDERHLRLLSSWHDYNVF